MAHERFDIVNQSISSSFDPAKMMCISCKHEHPVISKKPVVMIFSDQNFVSSLETTNAGCINILRVENASLVELYEIACEVIGDVTLPEGSVLMFGTVSHLARNGISVYARDWTEVVARSSESWLGIRICPLIPLIGSECPGSVIREISELACWLETVYETDPQGLTNAWTGLVAAMESYSMGTTSLEVMETYKQLLPSTLFCGSLDKVVTFCSHNSRPVTFKGLPKDRCCELLSLLLTCIYENFRACSSPEDYLVRADVSNKISEEKGEQKIMLVGASNLRHSVPHFAGTGSQIVD